MSGTFFLLISLDLKQIPHLYVCVFASLLPATQHHKPAAVFSVRHSRWELSEAQ